MKCSCGSNKLLGDCCGLFVSGKKVISTAEELMRSRYVAFHFQNEAYLLATWYAPTRPTEINFDPMLIWQGLEIVDVVDGGLDDIKGVVEFKARYEVDGQPGLIYERSRFVKTDGRWFYVNGDLLS
jgi:SEC-C motif domain protein